MAGAVGWWGQDRQAPEGRQMNRQGKGMFLPGGNLAAEPPDASRRAGTPQPLRRTPPAALEPHSRSAGHLPPSRFGTRSDIRRGSPGLYPYRYMAFTACDQKWVRKTGRCVPQPCVGRARRSARAAWPEGNHSHWWKGHAGTMQASGSCFPPRRARSDAPYLLPRLHLAACLRSARSLEQRP